MYRHFIKPLLDKIAALMLLAVLAPLMALIALAIYISMGKPILFRQQRVGYKEKIFTIYKFRTMNDKTDDNGELLPDNERLEGIGAFIRKYSLDELPQLYNILKGDMSFIGPRPLLVEYLPHYTQEQRKRHDVLPGISGLAQVKGRNLLSWHKRFRYDTFYVRKLSFCLDMYIILLTFIKLIKKEGVFTKDNQTMPKFNQDNP
ncbi:MAG: sugar transferase [Epsilonproteobacteria bacterium]|nr:sugar transferase [Campylobacterota bacterium]